MAFICACVHLDSVVAIFGVSARGRVRGKVFAFRKNSTHTRCGSVSLMSDVFKRRAVTGLSVHPARPATDHRTRDHEAGLLRA